MERLHTIIRFTIWMCIAITSMLLVDWIGRILIEVLP